MATTKAKARKRAVAGRNSSVKRSPLAVSALALKGLVLIGSKETAMISKRFFKTSTGEYGEGDRFLGIRLPAIRQIANAISKDADGAIVEIALPLLRSTWHEARSLALVLLVRQFQKGDLATQEAIYRLYLQNTKFINNWDLVDMSAEQIVGGWLADKPVQRTSVLMTLAKSSSLWDRRIAILATFHAIKRGEYKETLRIAKLLMNDDEDLIHKAVGWMLREVGKRVGVAPQEAFLKRYYRQMPRTMLRYAIERLAEPKRKRYLLGVI